MTLIPGPHHNSLDSLLADPDIDAVIVCTPSGTHANIGVRVLQSGRGLVIEKPMDVSLEA